MQQSESKRFFQDVFPFWDKLTQLQQQMLFQGTFYKKYKKGGNIHGGSGECTGGIVLKSGCIRTYLLSDEGKEITLYRLYPGDVCMLSASCVLESITFDVFVDAEEDSECYIVSSKNFMDLVKQNMYVENYVMNIVVSRFSDVIWAMQQILFMSFDKRLAIFLYDEMSKLGDTNIRLTQEQMAKYMGSAREVVSRMLKYFNSEGIAEPVRGGVKILDKEKLRRLAIQ